MSFAHVFAAFGLTEQATALKRIFHLTNAYIGGSIALSCHMGDEITPYQDLDIVYTPSADAPVDITLMLFDIVFAAAGYERRDNSSGSYKRAKALHIDFVANWIHRDLRRMIQVVVRSADAPADRPAYAEADFDICQFYLKYEPANGDLVLLYNPANSALTPEIAEEIRTRRVMRIGNLKGQNRVNSLLRLRKYYERGFAFEGTRTTTCSCACGHEHTVKKEVRLTLGEASAIVRAEHARVNTPTRTVSIVEDVPSPVTTVEPPVRPPPLEIPPILEITDVLETPPRVKRTGRLVRKDDSWIRSNPTE